MTDRQRDRETDRETDRQTDRQTDTHTHTHTHTYTRARARALKFEIKGVRSVGKVKAKVKVKGVRTVGRPKRRWRDDIVGQQGAVWTKITKDRESWRTLAEDFFLQWKDTA